ncbi:Uncharacterised protein [Moraxella ovis]|uniref:Uncharacterized protein n=1 Tax=Moraxella ovis TaxID=29433 RepID=A0A378PI75_9GAMM|nr:hypothetical protein [Moraxella ovis]SPX86979.1 Uncharacterised protein [Moraxella ovis]STY86106.1 Uncharacterised protein [Moraxella ovis]STZ06143.1 Uncharacterised protein [Moraxella ovis]
MKKLSILALTATIATAPVFAEVTLHQTTLSVELSTQPTQATDLSFAFDDVENLQAIVMTDKEMAETEGAVANFAIGSIMGGLGGHYGYLASSVASGTHNKYAHLAAITTGAGAGAMSPVVGATAMVNGMRGVAVGAVVGGVNGYASTLGTTHNIR